MHAQNTAADSATPAKDRFPRPARRYHAHNPVAGRKASRDVPFSAITPHNNPKPNQGSQPSRSSITSVSQMTRANNRADRLVSQMARVHQNMTLGSNAHAHADPTATFSENMRRAIRKIGMHVSAEQKLLKLKITMADALL